ncbi:hypothetical protein Rhe02_64110 [Rhizocola hellebori]|uniref:Uncharacterized protein n=2 Tax=Rhizocola hellebori TaxID=1392758 RepID=A0A8J3QEQ4_9ACTN|nr:hypothetical protein Rhe02_64110 [Rhizocola hellebori]
MDDPTRHLTTPTPEAQSVAAGFVSPTALFDLFSPSAWLFDVVKAFTNVDVLGEFVSPLSGHWTMVSAYGDALSKLSLCLRDLSADVQAASTTLDDVWDGNASDAAYVYFAQAAGSLTGHAQAVQRASVEYKSLARAMWHLMEAMKGLLQALLDRAARAALYALAGTLTAETGVGAAVGYGLAAYEIAQILRLVARVTLVSSAAESIVFGFSAFVSTATKEIEDVAPSRAISGSLSLAMAR